MAPAQDLFVARVEDFLAGLQAAKRSQHTLDGYRNDLLKLGARIAAQLHGRGDDALELLTVAELDQRDAHWLRRVGV